MSLHRFRGPLLRLFFLFLLSFLSCCLSCQVSLSAFSFMFSEMVQYFQDRVTSITDLERK